MCELEIDRLFQGNGDNGVDSMSSPLLRRLAEMEHDDAHASSNGHMKSGRMSNKKSNRKGRSDGVPVVSSSKTDVISPVWNDVKWMSSPINAGSDTGPDAKDLDTWPLLEGSLNAPSKNEACQAKQPF